MTKQNHESDVAFIQALAELLETNDLTELSVKRNYGNNDSLNVTVSRAKQVVAQAAVVTPAAAPVSAPVAAPTLAPSAPGDDPSDLPGAVASPMVGTVYMQAEPGTPAFVSVGDQVSEGQTLLIIEAMKTMNQIPAPHAGKVKRILIEDGAPVEFGAPLMIIE
ncbi:MAG: acetyl-CoA carboxylase biotin carboxyl carrier protein [Rhodobacteraceae bacterium]|nr:acetyl-CoA carboxylase biotin carboxyl carrier protein [Paracoccaceae bacterium]